MRKNQATICKNKYAQSKCCRKSNPKYKNHLVAGLCAVDKNFPMQLWDELLPQSEITLNIL